MKVSNEIKVGVLAIIAIAISIWGYYFLKGKNILNPSTTLYAFYKNVGGLNESDPVISQGLQIGIVKAITPVMDEKQGGVQLKVSIDLQKDFFIPKTALASITETSPLGGKALVINFDKPCVDKNCVEDGDVLKSNYSSFISTILEQVTGNLDGAKSAANEITDSLLYKITNNQDIKGSLTELQLALRSFTTTSASMNKLLLANSSNVTSMASNMDAVTSNIKSNNAAIDQLIKNAATITEQLKQGNLKQTTLNANASLAQLEKTLASTQSSIAELNSILKKVDNKEGSLGLLVNDKALYNNLTDASKDLDLLLKDFRLNPKRYVHISVFGKKQKEYAPLD